MELLNSHDIFELTLGGVGRGLGAALGAACPAAIVVTFYVGWSC